MRQLPLETIRVARLNSAPHRLLLSSALAAPEKNPAAEMFSRLSDPRNASKTGTKMFVDAGCPDELTLLDVERLRKERALASRLERSESAWLTVSLRPGLGLVSMSSPPSSTFVAGSSRNPSLTSGGVRLPLNVQTSASTPTV